MKYPSWQKPLEEALLETDPDRLTASVCAAEEALLLRSHELIDAPDDGKERQAIKAATEELLRIKTERLGWPPIPDVAPDA
jgi:hypothetical protein